MKTPGRTARSKVKAVAIVPAQEGPAEEPRKSPRFPVVGIGASAGGLEALESFFSHLPDAPGMAFVVVQHLDPTHKGIMPELLQRMTAMPVYQAKDRMKVKPNAVFVIPPNRDLSILHGSLYLLTPSAPRGLRLPIDFFFRALARDQQEMAVGVVLSGMGTDGTLGLRAVKEMAGVTMVQSPATARFEGMPRSAVDAGLADFVVPAEELGQSIRDYFRHVPLNRPKSELEEKGRSGLEKVLILLRAQTGHDFSLYKKSTVYRRIERRMGIHQIDKIATYIRFLRENSQEIDLLFRELLIGVTSFFRDPETWEQLKAKALPALLAARPAGTTLRAWIPGCSTGEEAFSLAIVFRELLDEMRPRGRFALQVFATDLDGDAIDRARQGWFPLSVEQDVSPDRLRRFFAEDEGRYRISKEIREMVIFAPQNLIQDAPFTKLDLLVCRNLLIYFEPELQARILPLFHYSLSPGGVMLLGSAESVGPRSDLFSVLDGKAKLFQRIEPSLTTRRDSVVFPIAGTSIPLPQEDPAREDVRPTPSFQAQADRLLLQVLSPAAVVVNGKGDILYVSGRTGKYLEPAVGKANWNLFAMAREPLHFDLSSAFQKAVRTGEPVTLRNLLVDGPERQQAVDVKIRPIEAPEALRGLVVIAFADVEAPAEAKEKEAAPSRGRKRGAHDGELEMLLQRTREELQSSREEMQTSQEELKSTNEELQSTNEELQSTNEELTTSKEELQSLNEELQTVNAELQAKVTDLSRANNDMKNLLNSTDIATVFLDGGLNVRRFTTQASKIIQLIPGDVGRPFTDIASSLLYPQMASDVKEVLRTLVFSERIVPTNDGRQFRIRVMPYRTMEDRIDGVVITFTDISGFAAKEKP